MGMMSYSWGGLYHASAVILMINAQPEQVLAINWHESIAGMLAITADYIYAHFDCISQVLLISRCPRELVHEGNVLGS